MLNVVTFLALTTHLAPVTEWFSFPNGQRGNNLQFQPFGAAAEPISLLSVGAALGVLGFALRRRRAQGRLDSRSASTGSSRG
jgi:hypothetical protein